MGTKTLTKKTLLLRERLKESLEQTKRRQMLGHVAPHAPPPASVAPQSTAAPLASPPTTGSPPEAVLTSAPTKVAAKVSAQDAATSATPREKTDQPQPARASTSASTIQTEAPRKELSPTKPAASEPAIGANNIAKTGTADAVIKPAQMTKTPSPSSNIMDRLPKSAATTKASGKAGTQAGQPAQDYSDKRFSRRKNTDLAGYVCNNGSTIKIPVVIKDLSATGARFTLDRESQKAFNTTPGIAEKFKLYIIYDRMYVSCRTQWRDGQSYGVRYLSAPQFF